jgi:hypothetical protein
LLHFSASEPFDPGIPDDFGAHRCEPRCEPRYLPLSTLIAAPGSKEGRKEASAPADTSQALAALLNRLKAAVDPDEIRQLSDQIERVVFHKQFTNA